MGERSRFTMVDLLVTATVVGLLMMVVIPTCVCPRTVSKQLLCLQNLRGIYNVAAMYADTVGRGSFPIGEGDNPPAYKSFQVIAEYLGEEADPETFWCPASRRTPAKRDPSIVGKCQFRLTEKNVSYAWPMKKLSLSRDAWMVLVADESIENHGGRGINVVYVWGNAVWVPWEELQAKGWDPTPQYLTPPPGGRAPVKAPPPWWSRTEVWIAIPIIVLALAALAWLLTMAFRKRGHPQGPPPGEGPPAGSGP